MRILPPSSPYRGTRGIDAYGGGGFGAPRRKRCSRKTPTCPACKGTGWIHYTHKGLDFVADPGADAINIFPDGGRFVRAGWAYVPDRGPRNVRIEGLGSAAGYLAKYNYVTPLEGVEPGQEFAPGEIIGTVDNVALWHDAVGKMINHLHLELFKDGVLIDSTPFVAAS